MKQLPNFATPHSHVRSFDSASTPEAFALRELELGGEYLTVTDHGTLEANRHIYDLCQNDKRFKGKLTPIMGLEGYFRDDDCPILKEAGVAKDEKGTFAEHLKYMHLTMHFMDQEAQETATRLISKADLRAEKHGSERKPLFGWADLEELGSKNITFCSSCLIGMVSRHLLAHDDYKTAIRYYDRIRSLVKPGNFYVELFPHVCDKNWDAGTFLKYADGTEEKLPDYKNLGILDINGKEYKVKAGDVADDFAKSLPTAQEKYQKLVAVMQNRKMVPLEQAKLIVGAEKREGYLYNECKPWAPDRDVMLGVNRFVMEIARRYGDKILISDDSHFARAEEKVAQDIRLGQNGSWRFATSYHRFSNDEAFKYFNEKMGVSEATFEGWVENSHEWGSRFKAFKFKPRKSLPTSFYPAETLKHTIELVKKHGRMDWNNRDQRERLQAEIELLHKNGTIDLLPYFFLDEEVCDMYLRKGELTGPGRGSAAGLELAYDLGITHVDPRRYGLSMDRFMTKSRIESGKLPDIDQDLPHRDFLVDPNDSTKGWLTERFGECVSQISTDTTMKLRSSIKDVFRAMHGTAGVQMISPLTNELPMPPQGITDAEFVFGYKGSDGDWIPGIIETDPVLQGFVKTYPKEWEIVQKCLGMTRQKGRHACAFVIADEPISNFIPITTVGGVRVTQYTAGTVESSGGLKMDFLIVNSLKDIGACIRLIQDRHAPEHAAMWTKARSGLTKEEEIPGMRLNGKFVPAIRCVPRGGQFYDIWDLPEDQPVFHDICEGKTESVFQFNTHGARQFLRHFDVVRYTEPNGTVHKGLDSIEALAAFTALDRPGPLDYFVEDGSGGKHNMLVEFARRAQGLPESGDSLPILKELLPETYGVIVYQEQLTKIYQTLGGTTGAEADEFRVHISKKQMAKVIKDKEVFVRGAYPRLGEEVSEKLWAMMETFARYGFNKSHAVCYVVIGYACAWLKHYYPLEWWTAVLRNADRNEINDQFWTHCGKYIEVPDIRLSKANFSIDGDRIRAPLWLLRGIGDKAQEQIIANGPYSDIGDFCRKIEDWRVKNATMVNLQKTDDATGEVKIVPSRRLATTALNSRVVTTLIVSGAMDSLFGEIQIGDQSFPMTVGQKIQAYEEAKILASGKKKKNQEVQVRTISPLVQFQMRKQILPALSEPLLPLVLPLIDDKIENECFLYQEEEFPLAPTEVIAGLCDPNPNPKSIINKTDFIFAAVGYVTEDRRFRYENRKAKPDEPKTKTAVELSLNVDGYTLKAVRWPSRKQPDWLSTNLGGAIVVALFRKQAQKKPTIEEVIVVQSPITTKLEEASPEVLEEKQT
jgi:DNA polymerase III alpha subunit